jgi:hypothetical protein
LEAAVEALVRGVVGAVDVIGAAGIARDRLDDQGRRLNVRVVITIIGAIGSVLGGPPGVLPDLVQAARVSSRSTGGHCRDPPSWPLRATSQ